MSGAGEGSRTPDLLITNQLLCQLSYASAKKKHKKAADSEETAIPYFSEHIQEMSRYKPPPPNLHNILLIPFYTLCYSIRQQGAVATNTTHRILYFSILRISKHARNTRRTP